MYALEIAIYRYMLLYQREHFGVPVTMRQIADHLGFASVSHGYHIVQLLTARGYCATIQRGRIRRYIAIESKTKVKS